MNIRLNELRSLLRENGNRFTLIELLVVMLVLGILDSHCNFNDKWSRGLTRTPQTPVIADQLFRSTGANSGSASGS